MPRRGPRPKRATAKPVNTSPPIDNDTDSDDDSLNRVEHESRTQARRPGPRSRTQNSTRSTTTSQQATNRPGPRSQTQTNRQQNRPQTPPVRPPPVQPPATRRRKHTLPKHLLEIKRLQESTNLLMPRLPFSQLVREIMGDSSDTVCRITPDAFAALQNATEIYMTQVFEDAYKCTIHRDRVTLMVKDIRLALFLRDPR